MEDAIKDKNKSSIKDREVGSKAQHAALQANLFSCSCLMYTADCSDCTWIGGATLKCN